MKISIVIPNYNGEKVLAGCLESISHQTISDIEIIVVDDASTDGSLAFLEKCENIKLIRNEKNSGFAASVNRGIMASCGDYILLLNNDVEVMPDFTEQLAKTLDQNPKAFSVSSKMIRFYERDKIDDAGDQVNLLGWAKKRGDGKPSHQFNQPTRIFSTCAGAGIYRRSVFDEIGLFDETYFAYNEDVDISWRGQIYGYENLYEPAAICYHIGSATTASGKRYSSFKERLSGRNNLFTVFKNMPLFQLIINSLFLLIGFSLKVLFFALCGYGKEYCSGLKEGLDCIRRGSVKKVPYQSKHLKNYFRIEGQLLLNLIRH